MFQTITSPQVHQKVIPKSSTLLRSLPAAVRNVGSGKLILEDLVSIHLCEMFPNHKIEHKRAKLFSVSAKLPRITTKSDPRQLSVECDEGRRVEVADPLELLFCWCLLVPVSML